MQSIKRDDKIYRSSLIRLRYKENELQFHSQKTYFEPNENPITNRWINNLISKGMLLYFEYSENENNQLETQNFHIQQNIIDKSILYTPLSCVEKSKLDTLLKDLEPILLCYTIGIRLCKDSLCGITYYYYSTYRMKNGTTRMRGITQHNKIKQIISKLINNGLIEKNESENEILNFIKIAKKFRGISVTFMDNNITVKIYIRSDSKDVANYFSKFANIKINSKTAMLGINIIEKKVIGYNLYYI